VISPDSTTSSVMAVSGLPPGVVTRSGGAAIAILIWQFTQSGVLPGFNGALHQLAEDGPWFAATWLLGSNCRLEGQRISNSKHLAHASSVVD
jgi:hypothetical protein